MNAYYNENDPKTAAWLRELIKGGYIAPGDVDERSIEDILPNDLRSYTQCHFFAGIGGWSYALRLAGWPDDAPVWTGSCPCQPFSAAGKGGGFADERHLWPSWFHLCRVCKPERIFGEQVANALPWLDLVSADLESEGYAVGAAIVGAHSVGAPHIRQRLYWVADASCQRQQQQQHAECDSQPGRGIKASLGADADGCGGSGDLEHAEGYGRQQRGTESSGRGFEPRRTSGELAEPPRQQRDWRGGSGQRRGDADGGYVEHASSEQMGIPGRSWIAREADWSAEFIPCTDGKARPIEPGTFPLAHGVPHRVGLLRGYGNAIVPQVAAAFIEAYLSI